MPRKKTSSEKNSLLSQNFFQKIKWDDSYVSLAVGVIVVIVIAILGVVFVRGGRLQTTSSTEIKPTIESQKNDKAMQGAKGSYTVKKGDTLWSIAENFYKSGYNWVDIARVNKLSNPNTVFSGNKLIIPDVKPLSSTVAQKKSEAKVSISGTTHKVQKGDNLWTISVRAYGDGYSWVKIAKINNLKNPDLIHSGNVVNIPR